MGTNVGRRKTFVVVPEGAHNKLMPAAAPAREQTSLEVSPQQEIELNSIDYAHPYLKERGITEETAREFGVGFFSGRGSMSGRIVIPIHNEAGELVAYAGRSIDGSEPKYLFPAGFHKSTVVYNLHRAIENSDRPEVIVVEGFFDCMRVWQAGQEAGFFPEVVALMDCTISEEQINLLITNFCYISVMLDGDDAGINGQYDCVCKLSFGAYVNQIVIDEDQQPDELPDDVLAGLISCRTVLPFRPPWRMESENGRLERVMKSHRHLVSLLQ